MKWTFIFVFFLLLTSSSAQVLDSAKVNFSYNQRFQSDTIIRFAKSLLGVPYCYGGNTPNGFDCSGFVNYVFSNFGVQIPRSTTELINFGREIPMDSCRSGDVILFSGRNKQKHPVGHVGIIVSPSDEAMQFIHSATSNQRGVIITTYGVEGYYEDRFVKIIRVLEEFNLPVE